MALTQAIALLRVTDVARSMAWYRGYLAFVGDPFPSSPPHEFAILRHAAVELMLRKGSPAPRSTHPYDWDLYLRREGAGFREIYAAFSAHGIVTRRLERMPYGMAEFELTDPDGYRICLGQPLTHMDDLPAAEL
ncbi:MAG: hypothetical protein R3F18_20585 [Lysobacterales bacterium]|nr:hypothetical protein [Rhodanobacteraceae bacterium]